MTEQTHTNPIREKIEAAKQRVAVSHTGQNNVLPPTGFLRLPQVLKLIPVGRASWWEGMKQGRYPKGVKIGKRSTAWRVEDIRDLIDRLGAAE
ncbi:MAG: AlpA family phage regulatory protein [Hyphomicrobiaceae bacterium]|nr:AlpA family phage regulatory protein [Hyphomicrobiaceae bacterium]